jgi:hypothetical protein
VSHVAPSTVRRFFAEFERLSDGVWPASGLFGYSALIAALRLSHMYLLEDDRSVRSVRSVRSE